MSQLQSLRGMVDLLPEALQRWQVVESFAREHFGRSGFGEIRTPLLESTDLFCRGIGEGTDVVDKENVVAFEQIGKSPSKPNKRRRSSAHTLKAEILSHLTNNNNNF